MKPSQVSLALEGWNAANLDSETRLSASLQSLSKQTYPVDQCEVLIYATGSDPDHGADRYQAFLPNARLVTVSGSTYFRFKNLAARTASREVLAFADSDVVYEEEWLERMLNALEEHGGLVCGATRFEQGFLHRTRTICNWAATRGGSGPTDWFYGNNLVTRRALLLDHPFREDMGASGGGAVEVLRHKMGRDSIPIWFCAEARARHQLPPLWSSSIRSGAYQIRYRRLAPAAPWSWLVKIPLMSPFLIAAGLALKAWRRAWRLRRELPLRGWSLPGYWLSIGFVKSIELLGALAYAWLPHWVESHCNWFDVPSNAVTVQIEP